MKGCRCAVVKSAPASSFIRFFRQFRSIDIWRDTSRVNKKNHRKLQLRSSTLIEPQTFDADSPQLFANIVTDRTSFVIWLSSQISWIDDSTSPNTCCWMLLWSAYAANITCEQFFLAKALRIRLDRTCLEPMNAVILNRSYGFHFQLALTHHVRRELPVKAHIHSSECYWML